MALSAADIARHLQGCVIGDPSLVLTGFAPAHLAREGDLTFAESAAFFTAAEGSGAAAIVVDGPFVSERKTLIRVADARVAVAKVLPLFFPEPQYAAGVHPSSIISPSATIDPTAHIGPYCAVGDACEVGPHVVLMGFNHLDAQCRIGEGSWVFPHVTLYARTQLGKRVRIHAGTVIGSDGFGYVFDQGIHRKVPQVGSVVVEDDVEVGANVTIDRGALGFTVIGKGTKIDNLVQVAHNVETGAHCLLISQVGIAGSTKLGNYVTLAGQVGLSDHLRIGHRVMVGAKSGVMNHIPDGEKWLGTPAQPDRHAKRQLIAMSQLPEVLRRLSELEKQVRTLSGS